MDKNLMKKTVYVALILSTVLLALMSCNCRGKGAGTTEEPTVSITSPIANLEKVFTSAPGTDGTVRITGLDGAVAASAVVTVINEATAESESTAASTSGGFQVEIAANAGQNIVIAVTSNLETETTSFTASALDPTPLSVFPTDVSVYKAANKVFVTIASDTGESLISLDLSTQTFLQKHTLTEVETGVALTDLIAIEAFEDSGIAMLIDRKQIKFYLLDLNTVTTMADPIAITGNLATILAQNTLFITMTFRDVEESEELIRVALNGIVTTLNQKIAALPDGNTPVMVDIAIGQNTSEMVFAGTMSGVGLLARFTIQNSDLSVSKEETLALSAGVSSALAVYNDRSTAAIANQTEQEGLGEARLVTICDLSEMKITSFHLVDGAISEFAVSPDETDIAAIFPNLHKLMTFASDTFETLTNSATGPTPARLALSPQGDKATVLNESDTTVSFIAF